MTEPVIADKLPVKLEIEAGTYTWCACGRSQNQPYCDGSHHGTGIEPVEFTILEKKRVSLCNCKLTKKSPYCDGTHKGL